jgi:hemoglobin/transferrin/lactoferrin receptor protein
MQTTSRLRALLIASAAVAALATGAPAFAADVVADAAAAIVEPVTVTATRSEKPLDQVPVTVTVISSQQIDDQLVTDIKDLVRMEAGVSVRTNPTRFTAAGATTGRDGASGFNIRGIEGNRVLIVTDGVRVPDAYSFGAQSNGRGDYVDLGTLKSVEILRGPASALYGSDGVAGAVSFVTKDPSDYLKDGKAWMAGGSVAYSSADEGLNKSLVAAGRNGAWSGLVSFSRRDSSEQENQGENNSRNSNRTAPNPQDNVTNSILAKLVFEPNDQNRTRLTYDHQDRKTRYDVLTAIAPPPLASTSVIGLIGTDGTHRDRVSLDHLYTSEDGFIRQAHVTAYWQTSTTNEYSAEDRFTAADRTRIGTFDNEVVGGALELHSSFEGAGLTHNFTYGGDYSVTTQKGIRSGTVPPAGETFPTRAFPTTDYTLAGLYVQDEISLLDGKLTAYPALRYDHYELEPEKNDPLYVLGAPAGSKDSHVSPKIGVVWNATNNLGLFVNYGAGFKAPAPSQVNNSFVNPIQGYRSIPNPDLKPETSTSIEGGVRFRADGVRASATAFKGEYDDFISQVQVGGAFTPTNPAIYQYTNLSNVEISGAEGRVQADLGGGFTASAAIAYAKGTIKTAGVETALDTVDPIKFVSGVSWRESGGLFGGQLTFTHSDGKTPGDAGGTCGVNCYTPKGFNIFDATAYWNLTPDVSLRGGVFNITDAKYSWWSDVRGLTTTSTVLDSYTQPGRNYSVSLTVQF